VSSWAIERLSISGMSTAPEAIVATLLDAIG